MFARHFNCPTPSADNNTFTRHSPDIYPTSFVEQYILHIFTVRKILIYNLYYIIFDTYLIII